MMVSCSPKCDEPDIKRINSLYFELKQDGGDGFTQNQLDSIYYVRYVPGSNPLIADTVYPSGYFPEGDAKFLINDDFPFLNEQPPYFVVFGYQVVDPTTEFTTSIQDIELQGAYDGDCGYTNSMKFFTIDSQEVDMGGSNDFYLITR